MADFDHGATDSGPDPIADFSSCSHPFGPCPVVLETVRNVDPTHYPDPAYHALRKRLGEFHTVDPNRIVPGAGVSEIILRMVGAVAGDVLAWSPSFVEYRRASHVHRRRFLHASDPETWLARVPRSGIAFLCQPNNPDGKVHHQEFLDAAAHVCKARECRLVLDLAYADFCPTPPGLAMGSDLLFAPNKKFGMTGIRAGFAVCADAEFAADLVARAPSWVVGAHGVAFLHASTELEAMLWFEGTRALLRSAAKNLESMLGEHGWIPRPSETHYFAAQPRRNSTLADPAEHSANWTLRLRQEGVRVRDLSNTGMPGWLRLAARPEAEVAHLESVIARLEKSDSV
ncbi:MAG: aminotransferase class I/II-fold pyridoxal phosphate-dependent enzyme [Fibrobacterota bacterium]